MSNHEKPQPFSESTSERLSGGKVSAKSKPSKRHRDKEDTTSTHIQLQLNLFEQPLSTLGSAVTPNQGLSIDKLQPSATCIQVQRLLQKSEEDSTSSAKSFLPYWKESCLAISKELLSLTKTDLPGLGLTYSNGSANNLIVKSWFSTREAYLQRQKWLKTSSPSSTVLATDSTDSESTKLRSRKIQIYPSSELKKVWNKWLAACRY